jgi:outer membrane protein assembly factor BamA
MAAWTGVAEAAPWGPGMPVPLPGRFRLGQWVVEGDPLVDPEELAAFLPWASGDSVPPGAAGEAALLVRRRLVEAGWWAAGVRAERGPERPEGRDVVLRIAAGEPVVVGEVGVRGNLLLTREEILSRMALRPGRPFEASILRADGERILRAYSERGRPLARFYPSRFHRTADGRLGFVVRLGEGTAVSVESVRALGAGSTDQRALGRIAGVRPGDEWDVRKVERMASRLRREGLFTSVGEPRIVRGSRDNLVGVEIDVEEGPSSSIFGVVGYNPRPDGGGDLVGQAHLDLRNLLGTARRAELRFEKQPGDVQDLAFRLREPWVLGSPISVELGAAQELREPVYSRTDLDVTAAVPVGDFSTFRLAAERRSSSFENAAGVDVSETSTGGSAAWAVDLRDRRVNATRGWAGDLLVGARETGSGILRTRVEAAGQWLLPRGRTLVISEEVGVQGVWTTRDGVPLHEQYYLGGTRTLRGYREEQFHGEQVWWTRSELRYRLTAASRAYVFGDVGGFEFESATPSGPYTERDVLAGAGIGASLETRGTGAVRFELALGRGDGFSDAKIHVGLEQEF